MYLEQQANILSTSSIKSREIILIRCRCRVDVKYAAARIGEHMDLPMATGVFWEILHVLVSVYDVTALMLEFCVSSF